MNKQQHKSAFVCFIALSMIQAIGECGELFSRRMTIPVRPTISDIELENGGILRGVVTDTIASTEIQLLSRSELLSKTTTNSRGEFGFRGLRGGLYELRTVQTRNMIRVWAPGTAPPTATKSLTLYDSQMIVRGQRPVLERQIVSVAPADLLFFPIIAAGVIVPLTVNPSASP